MIVSRFDVKKRIKDYRLQHYSFLLLFLAIVLSAIGVLVIRSATFGTDEADIFLRQIMGIGVGIFVAVVVSLVDYHLYIKFFPFIYLVCCILLLLVLVMGEVHGGAKRWLVFPVIGQLQPSEFSKIMLILFWSALFALMKEKLNKVWGLALILVVSALPLALILKEPDLSTTIV